VCPPFFYGIDRQDHDKRRGYPCHDAQQNMEIMSEKGDMGSPDPAGKGEDQQAKGERRQEMVRLPFLDIQKEKDAQVSGKNGKKDFDPENRHDWLWARGPGKGRYCFKGGWATR